MGKRMALAVAGIAAELAKATKVGGPKEGESHSDYGYRLCEGVSKLTDDAFDKLSKPAQGWYNTAAAAINEEPPKEIPPFPDAAGKAAPAKAEAATPEPAKVGTAKETKPKEATVTKKVKGGAKAAKKPAAPKSEAKKKAAAEPKAAKAKKPAKAVKAKGNGAAHSPRSESTANRIRGAVLSNPKGDLEAICKKAGVDVSPHAEGLFRETHQVLVLKSDAKARKEAKDSGSVSPMMAVVLLEKPTLGFEDAAKAVGVKKPEIGSHVWNRWNRYRQVVALLNA